MKTWFLVLLLACAASLTLTVTVAGNLWLIKLLAPSEDAIRECGR